MCKEAAMPKPINKQQLLDEAQRKYEALERQFASLTPEEIARPEVIGTWSIKEILRHMLEWQRMLMDWYEAELRGETPAVPADGVQLESAACAEPGHLRAVPGLGAGRRQEPAGRIAQTHAGGGCITV